MIRRRTFIAGLGSAAAWSVSARAQQQPLPVIGYLSARSRGAETPILVAFRTGLQEVGYIERRNVTIEFRFADGQLDQVPALAAELAHHQPRPRVIVALGGFRAATLAREADPDVPIVFNSGTDPVRVGLVTSFNRPGGNTTGVFSVATELLSKNLGFLHELVPRAKRIAVLAGSDVVAREQQARDAAVSRGLQLSSIKVATESDLGVAFAELAQEPPDALVLLTAPLLVSHAEQITAFVAKLGIPAIYNRRDYATRGGLVSYGDNVAESYRHAGLYAGRILRGEKAGDLPVFQSDKLELVINLATARTLGLTIPETLLATADEVIQ
jgi:putative ABC transport system substrate-binding protein